MPEAKELVRNVTGIDTIPTKGDAATGTLTQNAVEPLAFNGTGTELVTEMGQNTFLNWLFFPDTSPPQLLKVVGIEGDEFVRVLTAPTVAITDETFHIVTAKNISFSVFVEGNAAGTYDGVSVPTGWTLNEVTNSQLE